MWALMLDNLDPSFILKPATNSDAGTGCDGAFSTTNNQSNIVMSILIIGIVPIHWRPDVWRSFMTKSFWVFDRSSTIESFLRISDIIVRFEIISTFQSASTQSSYRPFKTVIGYTASYNSVIGASAGAFRVASMRALGKPEMIHVVTAIILFRPLSHLLWGSKRGLNHEILFK